ncbi:MAG: alpha-L-arabinofuranosidase C-terminal domain-containing protein [Rhodothermales bacterium]
MDRTRVFLHTRHQVGRVHRRLFGGFVEHLGRAIYGGLYDPDSAHADDSGWRTDVLAALRKLDFTVMRYPGGNFVSGYRWQDGIGPRSERPARLDEAWNSLEPNHVGTDEFLQLAETMGWEPMVAVNLGTGTPDEAAAWVAYCNGAPDSEWGRIRADNGRREPYGVRLWCLGNEMDGPWQIGHVPAGVYAERARQAMEQLRTVSPDIEVVACGSSNTEMPTWLEWDQEVLQGIGPGVDYISLHRYAGKKTPDTLDFLAITNDIDRQIESVDATCRFVAEKGRFRRRAFLCFDEWNVWYRTAFKKFSDGGGKFAQPLIEERYNLEDALVVAGFINSFLRHADVVHVANLAQIANAIAPVLTLDDRLLVQSIYWPLAMMASRRNGVSLVVGTEGPSYVSDSYGLASCLDVAAVHDADRVHLSIVNRSEKQAIAEISVDDRSVEKLLSMQLMTGDDPKAENTLEAPDRVTATDYSGGKVDRGRAVLEMPPLSYLACTIELG